MQTNPEQWAGDVRYLAKLADWAAGEGFCKIEALADPDEWCIDAYDRAYPGKNGEGYSADTLADGLVASIQAAFAEREARLVGALDMVGKVLPSAAGLDDAPDSKIIACYMNMGELRAIKSTLAALKDRTNG